MVDFLCPPPLQKRMHFWDPAPSLLLVGPACTTFEVSLPIFEVVTHTRIQYVFYSTFLNTNPQTIMLPPNFNPLHHVAQLRRQLRHLPTRKPNLTDLTAAIGRRKSARLSIKTTKNNPTLSATQIHQKSSQKNTPQ